MNNKNERHSKFTFQDTLQDYAELSGFSISEEMKKVLTDQFYDPNLDIEPLCAIQYGKSVWFLGYESDIKSLEGFFSIDTKARRIIRLGSLKKN